MKKMLRLTQTLFMASLLASCGGGNPSGTEEEFKPSLDTTTECSIRVDGDYGNFEALEAEFDRFKEYYPKVHLSYLKIDGSVADVLNGEEAPNIFFCHPKMIGNEQYASVVSHMDFLNAIWKERYSWSLSSQGLMEPLSTKISSIKKESKSQITGMN